MTVRLLDVCGAAQGRPLLVATMHGKERVLGPRLASLGFRVYLAAGYDTDALGTFCGDIRRPGTAREAAVEKARRACAITGVRRAVASEGPYRPCQRQFPGARNVELLAFVDLDADFEYVEVMTNVPTRFAMGRVPPDLTSDALRSVLDLIGWPEVRAIVLATDPGQGVPPPPIFKGVGDEARLERALRACAAASPDGLVHVESDLRAHMNPSRMRSIARVADRLVAHLDAVGYASIGAERSAAT